MFSGTHSRTLSSHALDRILRIRRRTYLFLFAIMAGLGAAQIIVRRPSVAPIYVPIAPIVATVLFTAMIRTILGTVFGQIQLATIERAGRDRAAEHRAMRRPAIFFILFGVAAAVLLLPSVHAGTVGAMTETTDRTMAAGASSTFPGGLASVDAAGLSRVTALTISTLSGSVEVGIAESGRAPFTVRVDAGTTWSWTPDSSRRLVYDVSMTNPTAGVSEVRVTIVRDAFPELFGIVPAALVLVAAANLASFLRLRFFAQHYWDADTVMRRAERPIVASRSRYGVTEGVRTHGKSFLDLPTRPRPGRPTPSGRRREPSVVLIHQAPVAERAPPKRPPRPLAPLDVEAVLKDAAKREAKGDFKGANARYDAILHAKPGHPAASLAKANLLRRFNRGPEALGVYRELLHKDPDNLAALRGCLAIHEADESWRDALDIVDRILALRPDDAYIHATQGDILVALRRQPEAVAAYTRAVGLRPGDAAMVARANRIRTDISLLLSHAFVSSASGNLQAALATFDDVLRIEEDNLDALVGKSGVLRRLGEVNEARTLLERVLARDPGHRAALQAMAQLPAERDDRRSSPGPMNRLPSVLSDDLDALLDRGDRLARMGNVKEAFAAYEAALMLHPDDADATEKLRARARGDTADRAVLRELFRIRSLGPAKARAIADAGFRTVDDLRRAHVEQLGAVPGVGRKLAETIVRHARQPRLARPPRRPRQPS